jgi:hypothetical protein
LLEGLTVRESPTDADEDGVSDEWERARGLDPQNSSDHARPMPSGYTALEEWANELAQRLIAVAHQPEA